MAKTPLANEISGFFDQQYQQENWRFIMTCELQENILKSHYKSSLLRLETLAQKYSSLAKVTMKSLFPVRLG